MSRFELFHASSLITQKVFFTLTTYVLHTLMLLLQINSSVDWTQVLSFSLSLWFFLRLIFLSLFLSLLHREQFFAQTGISEQNCMQIRRVVHHATRYDKVGRTVGAIATIVSARRNGTAYRWAGLRYCVWWDIPTANQCCLSNMLYGQAEFM